MSGIDKRHVARVAKRLAVPAPALEAVIEAESGGRVFALVNGRKEPLIRWEGHYFDDRLTGEKQAKARSLGLAHPRAGAVKNPRSQARRWAMLENAMLIDERAALESCSWGVGQVMGAHWRRLGFDSVQAMVRHARSGFEGQLDLMIRYIKTFGLVDELQRLDFAGFARGYNGPAHNAYDRKMRTIYERLTGEAPRPAGAGMLRMGSKGARVRDLQALLTRAGYPVKVDGDFGPVTKQAVMDFQRDNGLTVDGIAGPETMSALSSYRVSPDEQPGRQRPSEVDEVRDVAGPAGLTGLIVAIRDELAELATALTGTGSETAEIIANIVMAGGALLGIGLAAYAIHGWWKSRQTRGVEA